MVISGPNTGGKTVALKTVGLAALSAQSGIPVAAEHAELPIFDRVLADIGDEQSIAADLSTFSAHMLNLKSMLEVATERSLVLVDEMGTGTAPEEGAALAVALLEEFRERQRVDAGDHASRPAEGVRFDHAGHRECGDGVRRSEFAAHVPAAGRRAGHVERDRNRAAAGFAGARGGARASQPFARIARGARFDRVSAPQPRRDGEMQARGARRACAARSERRALQTEWIERQKKRIAELEKDFLEAQKRLEGEVARLAGGHQGARGAGADREAVGAANGQDWRRKRARRRMRRWWRRLRHRSRIWALRRRRGEAGGTRASFRGDST